MRFNLIVAMCRNNGIGYKGKLPWHLTADLQYFSGITKGDGNNAVIMGNKTWQHLPVPKGKTRGLVDRDNFVLATTDSFDLYVNHSHLLKTFRSITELENYINQNKNDLYEDIWVIGGASVYKQFLDLQQIHKCYVTYIDADFECDAFFPADLTKKSEWKEIERRDTYDTTYDCAVSYVVYNHVRL